MSVISVGDVVSWPVRLDSRRRPTIPEEALSAARLTPGAELRVRVAEEGMLVLETPDHIMARIKARVSGLGNGSVVEEFLAYRRAEAESNG